MSLREMGETVFESVWIRECSNERRKHPNLAHVLARLENSNPPNEQSSTCMGRWSRFDNVQKLEIHHTEDLAEQSAGYANIVWKNS